MSPRASTRPVAFANAHGQRLDGRLELPAEDCAACESREGRVDVIDLELALEGDLDNDQRARLVEIAGRRPVHRTLDSETHVEARLAR